MIETKHGRSHRLIGGAVVMNIVGAALGMGDWRTAAEKSSDLSTPAVKKGWDDADVLASAAFGVGIGLGIGGAAVRVQEDDRTRASKPHIIP